MNDAQVEMVDGDLVKIWHKSHIIHHELESQNEEARSINKFTHIHRQSEQNSICWKWRI